MENRFEDWIARSHFVGADGKPVIFYHGTDCEIPFNIFNFCEDHSVGFHFGSHTAANDRLSQIFRMTDEPSGEIIPVYCRAERPLVLPDLFTWSTVSIASALKEIGLINEDEADFLIDSESLEMLYAVLEHLGYDCVVYMNECEGGHTCDDSLFIWRSSLIKGLYSNEFAPDDPRIVSQNETSGSDFDDHRSRERMIDQCLEEFRAFQRQRFAPAAVVAPAAFA